MSNNEEPDEGKLHVRFREGGKAAMYGIRIVRHGRGNPETGLRRSLNRAAYPSTRLCNIFALGKERGVGAFKRSS